MQRAAFMLAACDVVLVIVPQLRLLMLRLLHSVCSDPFPPPHERSLFLRMMEDVPFLLSRPDGALG